MKHSRQCFISYPNTSNSGSLSTLLVLGYLAEALSFMIYYFTHLLFSLDLYFLSGSRFLITVAVIELEHHDFV